MKMFGVGIKDGTPANDPPGIVGAGSATVAGKVTINAKGSHLEDIVGSR